MRRGPAVDAYPSSSSHWSRCHYQDTWIYSYIDCLTGDRNGSWCTPESHFLYLCFDSGCVQSHCSGLVFKFLKADLFSLQDTLWTRRRCQRSQGPWNIHFRRLFPDHRSSVQRLRIQCIARQKRAGANMHPWRTPDVMGKLSDKDLRVLHVM